MISNFPQRSLEWFLHRVGKITPSNCSRMMDRTSKGLPTAESTGYKWNLVVERLTGQPTQTFTNDAMRHGTETEPIAKAFFTAYYDTQLHEVGFIDHPNYEFAGCSPDGLISDDELIEVKCLTSKNHLEVLINNAPQKEHIIQCQAQLWITGRGVNRLMYFDPRLPDEYKHRIFYLERDEQMIARIEEEAINLDREVNEILFKLKESVHAI